MSNWEDITSKCPKLYKEGIYFECCSGWHDIILDLSLKIERILEKNPLKNQALEGDEPIYCEIFALQVKEKYGTLRFYMSCETQEIRDLIQEAEALSSQTCCYCGEPGKMRISYWIEVMCDKCYEEKK
jgi:hypothetical protein